jgi:hypothetical protein
MIDRPEEVAASPTRAIHVIDVASNAKYKTVNPNA